MRFAIESATLPNMRTRLDTDVAGIAYVTSFAGLAGFLALPLAASADRLTFNPKIHKYSKDMHIFKRLFFV